MAAAHPGKAILTAQDIVKGYGAQPVLRGVSITVHEGDRLGLIGVNGSGKSTLLQVMAGIEAPDDGLVTRSQGLRVGYLRQQCQLDRARTVDETLAQAGAAVRAQIAAFRTLSAELAAAPDPGKAQALGNIEHSLAAADAWNFEQEVKRVSTALRLPPADRPLAQLSGGELRRVDLAVELLAKPDLLLLDEPTNQIDTQCIEWIEEFLAGYRGSCVLVTHDRYFLDRIVNRIVELEFNKLYSFPGSYNDFLEQKSRVVATQARAESNRRRLLVQELAWLRRGPKARRTKEKARINRIRGLEQARFIETHNELGFAIPQPARLGKRILEAEHLSFGHGGGALFTDFSLIMQRHMRVGIVGPNGCGKTTLLRVLMGEQAPDAGTLRIGESTRFLYVDQTREDIDPDMTILKYVSGGSVYWDYGEGRMYVPAYLEQFLFNLDTVYTPMKNLSGGERNRLDIAKKLLRGGNFLVLDEPTNDLDLATLRVLEEAILGFDGCALIVSHDRYFLDRVCTHLLVFEGEGRIAAITGGYADYVLYRARREADRKRAEAAAAPPKPVRPKPKRAGLTYLEKQELAGIEDAIAEAEIEAERLAGALNAPGFYEQDHGRVRDALTALEAAQARVETLYARWQELENRNA